MISYKTCVVVSKVSKRVFPYYIWILIIYCSFKKREVKLRELWCLTNGCQVTVIRHMTFIFLIRVVTHLVDSFRGGLYPSAEKLDPISIPRGSLGGMGMFFKFIYTVVRM
jgi:hypothetical protein